MSARTQILVATLTALVLGTVVYLFSTEGIERLRSDEVVSDASPGRVPRNLFVPPETVPTTEDYGPVGPVAAVFAVPDVRTGLFERMDNPWVAVSSQSGAYRALSAPHRPPAAPGVVAVSPDGRWLAWGFADGVVVYDAVRDEASEIVDGLGDDLSVGALSPDGSRLTAYDGRLRIIDTASGTVSATLADVGARAARAAVWTPDGSALTYADSGRLVTLEPESGVRTTTPAAGVATGATLAWHASGSQLAATRTVRGATVVDVFEVATTGRLTRTATVAPDGHAQKQLFGFPGRYSVAVSALTLESGPVETIFEMSTLDNTNPPGRLMLLPADGIDRQTLTLAAEPVANGSSDFEEPVWPWSHVAKLVMTLVFLVFVLGIYLTRNPARRHRFVRAWKGYSPVRA